MKKYAEDLRVAEVEHPREGYVLLKLTPRQGKLPEIRPGQFVEIRIDRSPATFLRRPISVNFVDAATDTLWLLVHAVGEGTRWLAACRPDDTVNCVYPLGNGFSLEPAPGTSVLAVGGGVGTAPLLYYGKVLAERGCKVSFLLGGKTAGDVMQLEDFRKYGQVYVTTEDASLGEKGFVTGHSVLGKERFDLVATCGPKPMMVAVARWADAHGVPCEASLENLMACGLGACLCCVEKTVRGNLCVCKEGPVFDTKMLTWLN